MRLMAQRCAGVDYFLGGGASRRWGNEWLEGSAGTFAGLRTSTQFRRRLLVRHKMGGPCLETRRREVMLRPANRRRSDAHRRVAVTDFRAAFRQPSTSPKDPSRAPRASMGLGRRRSGTATAVPRERQGARPWPTRRVRPQHPARPLTTIRVCERARREWTGEMDRHWQGSAPRRCESRTDVMCNLDRYLGAVRDGPPRPRGSRVHWGARDATRTTRTSPSADRGRPAEGA